MANDNLKKVVSNNTSPSPLLTNDSDFLSKLPSGVVWQLICYLDTDSVVSLAGVNNILRKLVMARFHLTMALPISTAFANHLQKNPYSHNKPVLR